MSALAGDASASYTPSATKCLNQSKIGPAPACARMFGTKSGFVSVIDTNVRPSPLNVTTSCRNGRSTSSPSDSMTPKLIVMSVFMKSRRLGFESYGTIMQRWNNHEADNAGW
eukprot:30914-Pelagococcus_subviridis.AAC.5